MVKQKDHDLAIFNVLQSIIAGSPASRLDAKLREEKGWTYGVTSGINPLLGKGLMIVGTSVQIPFGVDALNEILHEFERLRKEPVTDAELTTAKNGLLRSFAARYSTIGKVASTMVEQFVYSLPANYDETIYDRIAKVSANDILAVSNRALKKENLVAVAVGDLEAMEAAIGKSDMGKVVIEREAKPTEKQ